MRKVTHSFEVRSNESSCRNRGRLGLEQVMCECAYSQKTLPGVTLIYPLPLYNNSPDHILQKQWYLCGVYFSYQIIVNNISVCWQCVSLLSLTTFGTVKNIYIIPDISSLHQLYSLNTNVTFIKSKFGTHICHTCHGLFCPPEWIVQHKTPAL